MLYLNSIIYNWLNYSFPDGKWFMGDQVNTPPKPQDAQIFGYYVIESKKSLTLGSRKEVYNSENDRIDITLNNSYTASVSIDIYSQNTTINEADASYVASLIEANVHSDEMMQYFDENNVGFLYFTKSENMSYVESAQTRKRWRLECEFNIVINVDKQVDRVVTAPFTLNLSK